MIYLASPYTNTEEIIELQRFELVCQTAAILLMKKYPVFSPVAHCHHMHRHYDLRGDFEFWKSYNCHMLAHADVLCVLTLPGWGESDGVQYEIKFASARKIPVTCIESPQHANQLPIFEGHHNLQRMSTGLVEPYLIYPEKKQG